jgi:hypothetical protein
VLEGTEAVQDQRLAGSALGFVSLMEEEAVAAEALAQSLDGAVGDTRLACDLAKAGAGDEPVEDGLEEVSTSQPIGGGEGL